MSTFIITDSTSNDVLFPAACRTGAVPRDFGVQPVGSDGLKPPSGIALIPESEWIPRIRDRKKYGLGLSQIWKTGWNGGRMPSKDQGQRGYCWSHSVTRCLEFLLAKANQKQELLSAYSIACKIKNFQDEGGWCGLSGKFVADYGVVPESLWPARSVDRSLDNAANWESAKAFRMTEGWYDLNRQVWDQDITWKGVVSLLLQNVPCAIDYMPWGHSVNVFDVDEKDGEVWPVIFNSWGDGWGDQGTALLMNAWSRSPDGAVAPLVSVAA